MNFEALIWREPWLAPVILNLKRVVKTQDIQEAAITPDGRTLYYNPEFWRHLSPEERLGVQLHEILHIVSLHAKRRENREHSKWNMACDMAINFQICASGYVLPPGVLPGEDDAAEQEKENGTAKQKAFLINHPKAIRNKDVGFSGMQSVPSRTQDFGRLVRLRS